MVLLRQYLKYLFLRPKHSRYTHKQDTAGGHPGEYKRRGTEVIYIGCCLETTLLL